METSCSSPPPQLDFLANIEADFQELRLANLADSFTELFLYRLETGLFEFV